MPTAYQGKCVRFSLTINLLFNINEKGGASRNSVTPNSQLRHSQLPTPPTASAEKPSNSPARAAD